MSRVIIAGGGLAGGLVALALATRRPDVDVTLVEQGDAFGGNHTWSFFDSDVADEDRWIVGLVDHSHWPDHAIHFPKRQRTIPIGYNSIRSQSLDKALRETLDSGQIRLGATITSLSPTSVTLGGGETLEADAVIDARGPRDLPGFELGWQKFVGRYLRFPGPHGVERPMIMDATVEQIDGYRFLYRLPVSPTELLIEDTYYSVSLSLDTPLLEARVDADAAALGAGTPEIIEQEHGVLPVVMAGDVGSLWRGAAVPRLGIAGGFFHPTTSYSLPDAVANASLIARQQDFSAPALHALLSARANRLWRERRFFRLLNRMLFRAAEPAKAYRVLEHFYRLPPVIVAHFYSARLTMLDKARILSGRPPVPIGRAIAALLGRPA
ncbi:MAG: lycopene beta-cyclase CrtY [Sphingomicrobium sp.]